MKKMNGESPASDRVGREKPINHITTQRKVIQNKSGNKHSQPQVGAVMISEPADQYVQ